MSMNLISPKTRVNGLPSCGDASSYTFILFDTIAYRRVTDGRTGRITIAKTALSIAARCNYIFPFTYTLQIGVGAGRDRA